MVDRDPITSRRYGCHAVAGVLVSNDAGESIQIHEDCTDADMAINVEISIQQPFVLSQGKDLL